MPHNTLHIVRVTQSIKDASRMTPYSSATPVASCNGVCRRFVVCICNAAAQYCIMCGKVTFLCSDCGRTSRSVHPSCEAPHTNLSTAVICTQDHEGFAIQGRHAQPGFFNVTHTGNTQTVAAPCASLHAAYDSASCCCTDLHHLPCSCTGDVLDPPFPYLGKHTGCVGAQATR